MTRTSPSNEDRSPLFEAALSYVARGWPVFPLLPRSKAPATRRGFKDATTNLKTIESWWWREPEFNIGLPTGLAFDVLDLDSAEAAKVLAQYAPLYTAAGPVVHTGKGRHIYVQTTGRGNGAGLLPGVDFRGEGGYVVAPPSIHPLGHSYSWVKDHGPDTELGKLPLDVLFLLDKHRESVKGHPEPENNPPILDVAIRFGESIRMEGGTRARMKCIFGTHEDSTPSLTLYLEKDNFYCYGCDRFGWAADLEEILNGQASHNP